MDASIRRYRALSALTLSQTGMSYEEVGAKLGIGQQRAKGLVQQGSRIAHRLEVNDGLLHVNALSPEDLWVHTRTMENLGFRTGISDLLQPLESLSPRERDVLLRRERGEPLRAVAHHLDVSVELVRQIENSARRKRRSAHAALMRDRRLR